MRQRLTISVAILLLLCFASTGEAARQLNCRSGGTVFTFNADISPASATTMWQKSSSDVDVLVFFSDDGAVWALGIGVEDRFERVTFGALPGVDFDVVVVKVSGPNTRCWLQVGAEVQALATSGPDNEKGVRELGSLKELAAKDPHYARIREKVREIQAAKRARR